MDGVVSELTKVVLPSTVIHIDTEGFYNCLKLKNCDLSNNVVYIGSKAFAAAAADSVMALEMQELPVNLLHLGSYAFYRCANVAFSFIPNNITTIDAYTFTNCYNITINEFGGGDSKLTSIGSMAFRGAGSSIINTLTFAPPLATIDSNGQFKNGYAGVTTINTHSLFGYSSGDDWEMALWDDASRPGSITTNEST
jgi:hypothetical protein